MIEYARTESPLEKVATNPLREVLHASVSTMSFSEATGKCCLTVGHCNEMDMVRHEAPGQYFDIEPRGLLRQKGKIGVTILIGVKDIHGADPTLGDVMWIAGDDDSRNASHGRTILEYTQRVKVK